jgi:hypothetical protein
MDRYVETINEFEKPRRPHKGARVWRRLPADFRFAFWTAQLDDIGEVEVMDYLAAVIEHEANQVPLFKHPRGRHSGLRPVLIRELLAYTKERYGKVLKAPVARIVGTVLGEDIKPRDLTRYMTSSRVRKSRDGMKKPI